MASKRLVRSCGGREGVRERACLLVGDPVEVCFLGEVLALLLAGERFDLVAVGVGEAALLGRCGSDLVERRWDDEDEDAGLGNRPGALVGVALVFNIARDEDEATADGVVDEIGPMRCLGLISSARGVCDGSDAGDRLEMAVSLRPDCASEGSAALSSSSDDAFEEDATLSAGITEDRAAAGDECALRLRLA